MMDILVIGGTRFFGIPMTEALLQNGHRVTVAVRGCHGNPFGSRVTLLRMDRTDAESVKSVLSGRKFDCIIDKVAYASNDVRALLQTVKCTHYLQMSSSAVYPRAHTGITENEFDPASHPLKWMNRPEDYAEGKRQAERAALEFLDADACTFVRYPVVIGAHDYTGRLRFYVQHLCGGMPVRMLHPDVQCAYLNEEDAGGFLAHLADVPVSGAVNGSCTGMISQREIFQYLTEKTGIQPVISADGDPAPYDGADADTSLDCTRADQTGFHFSALRDRMFPLLDSELARECDK